MNDQYASWKKGPAPRRRGCVDCHLPHDFVPKYIAKADNGYHHSKGFTLQDFHEPIHDQAAERARSFRRTACAATATSCTSIVARQHDAARTRCTCVHCHRSVGHGARDELR